MDLKQQAGSQTLQSRTLFVPTESTLLQIVRFGLTGAVATSIDITILMVLTKVFHVWYITAAALGYGIGITICYTLSVLWIFPYRRISDKRLEFVIFAVIGLVALGLTESILYLSVEYLHLELLLAKGIAVGLVFFFNFGARKAILFRRGA